MVLKGKLSIEVAVRTPASEFYELFASKLHHVQNVCEKVHETKLHEGEDWHACGASVKHWTYVIDGKVTTCKETVESIDEQNKTITYKLFDGEIDKSFKDFKLIFQAIEKNDGSAIIKWTVDYEKISEDVAPPYGYMEYVDKCTKDLDLHLLEAKKN